MANRGALDEVFDRIIERWTQAFTFVDAFSKRALTSLRSVRSVAKFP